MKEANRGDNRDESLAIGFARASGVGTHREGSFEHLEHRATGGAMMLLRMVDDEAFTGGESGLHRQRRDAPTGEILGDGQPRHHRDARPAITAGLTASGLSKVIVRKPVPMPPRGDLPPGVGPLLAQQPRFRLGMHDLTRAEELPVFSFFDHNPAIDLRPETVAF